MKLNYIIDGDGGNSKYNSMREVRDHIWMQSKEDKESYDGMTVVRQKKDGETEAVRIIRIKGGKVVLSKI